MNIKSTEIKNLEPVKTIAITHIGDYKEIGGVFEKLAMWAGSKNLWAAAPKMAGIYHDCPQETPVDKLRSEACIEDLSGTELGEGMKHYTISGGKYYVMQVEVAMSEYAEAWQKAYADVAEKGYECDVRDHYELYLSCADDSQNPDALWNVDLCIPIK